jgi:protein-S-isoprenylcysteine O-methyltransferase Ste14
MEGSLAYRIGLAGMFVLAALTFPILLRVPAPYGRHRRSGWGPELNARVSWVVMESPSVWLFAAVFARGPHAADAVPLLLFALWELHYLQRTLVFPLLMRGGARKPLVTAAMAFGFNLLNSWLNGTALSATAFPPERLGQPGFLLGVGLFAGGLALNLWSDSILRRLRAPGEAGYKIPRGGPFRWVSCPNYLGEIVEWAGFALAAGTLPALAFALCTCANLGPRAWTHHRWYRERFADYPPERRALIPGLL